MKRSISVYPKKSVPLQISRSHRSSSSRYFTLTLFRGFPAHSFVRLRGFYFQRCLLPTAPMLGSRVMICLALGCLITDFLMLGSLLLSHLIGPGLSGVRKSGVLLFGPVLSRSGSLAFGTLLPDCPAVDPLLLVSLVVSRLLGGSFMLIVALSYLIPDCLMLGLLLLGPLIGAGLSGARISRVWLFRQGQLPRCCAFFHRSTRHIRRSLPKVLGISPFGHLYLSPRNDQKRDKLTVYCSWKAFIAHLTD